MLGSIVALCWWVCRFVVCVTGDQSVGVVIVIGAGGGVTVDF